MNRRYFLGGGLSLLTLRTLAKTVSDPVKVEVITSTLEESVAAISAGADRIELAVDLQRGGITPDIDLVRRVVTETPHIPSRVMLRENGGLEVGGTTELDLLVSKARALSQLPLDGIVLGFLKNGMPDMPVLRLLLDAAPRTRVTFHNALERSSDPLAAIEALKTFPQIDILLVHGRGNTLEERAATLRRYADTWQTSERRLLVNGYPVQEAVELRKLCPFIQQFHFGSQVRTPEKPYPIGMLDPEKVRSLCSAFR